MKTVLVSSLVVLVLVISGCTTIDYTESSMENFMESKRAQMEVPGLAVATVGPNGILWSGYYGTYDGEHPVNSETLFMIASVSKLFIATAIMQQWELGKFSLDDDISDYLPFSVRNPRYPDDPITIQQLMIHRSSIRDRYPLYAEMYTIDEGGGDFSQDLGEFLFEYLSPEGMYYSADNFSRRLPGRSYEYSNYGAAVLAYFVEVLSGESFSDYCRDHIFLPLGMNHSFFFLRDIPSDEELAVPFSQGKALPHYSYPDYPAGSLRTTLDDLGRFCAFQLGGFLPGQKFLDRSTIDLMWGEYGQSTDSGEGHMGLLWVHWNQSQLGGIGHSGGDPGVSTFLSLYPEDGYGIVVLMNGNPARGAYVRQILKRLRNAIEDRND